MKTLLKRFLVTAGVLSVLSVVMGCPPGSCIQPYCSAEQLQCPANQKPQVIFRKVADYRYTVDRVSACATDTGAGAEGNQGVDLNGVYYRAVVGCDSKIHIQSAGAFADVYPPGNDTGVAVDSKRPDQNLLSQALTMREGSTAPRLITTAYPAAGVEKGTGRFCYGRNVSAEWLNQTKDGFQRSGAFVAYLESYLQEAYCVPQELRASGTVLASATSVPPPRTICSWPTGGPGTPINFGQPTTTFSACVNESSSCLCGTNTGCQAKPYPVGASDQLCKGFQWSCFCECPP